MPRPATSWYYLNIYVRRLSQMPSFLEVNRREVLTDWPAAAMESSPQVRLGRPKDVPFLPDIERSAAQAFRRMPGLDWIADDTPLPEEMHRASLQTGTCWVAVDDMDKPVGFLSAAVEEEALHILEMSVILTQQGRGIGTALIETARAWAQQHDLAGITLTTFRDVPWNCRFYTRMGFAIVANEAQDDRLAAVLREEQQYGFPEGSRCAMRLPL